jgi:hypothetical protein
MDSEVRDFKRKVWTHVLSVLEFEHKRWEKHMLSSSVADPRCLHRILYLKFSIPDPDPGLKKSRILDPGSKKSRIPEPDPHKRI